MTSIRISDISNPKVHDFLTHIDRSRGAEHNGLVNSREAAATVRKIANSSAWRAEANNALGTVPTSGAELMRLATSIEARTSGVSLRPRSVSSTTESGANRTAHNGLSLGYNASDKEVSLTPHGRVAIDGKVYKTAAAYSKACKDAALLSSNLDGSGLTSAQLSGLLTGLKASLATSLKGGGKSKNAKRLFSATMTLLTRLAKTTTGSERDASQQAFINTALSGLAGQKDQEIAMFYLGAMLNLHIRYSGAQNAQLKNITSTAMPTHVPVEEYTENRTKPLNVFVTYHHEFWKEEMAFFTEDKGWKLVKKNAKDTHREYEGTIVDPTGKKAPLTVRLVADQGEFDFLEKMSDPDAHLIIYNGHSAVGGNGSQAVSEADESQGLPKTIFMSNCRGKDNYAEFVEKYPEAMLITTRDPTYGDEEHRRMDALFQMFARGESFEFMRKRIQFKLWDEPADNYFFPDEPRGLLYSDRDNDGRIDMSELGSDPYYNVDGTAHAADFIRAINFVNSEYYYHWEVDHENGLRSPYGKEYADAVVADGIIANPYPNEIVRVRSEEGKDANGKKKTFFKVQYNPNFEPGNRDHYAGVVMAHTAIEISKQRYGKLKQFELMRSILMGFQSVHYMNVYEETEPEAYNGYLNAMGLNGVSYKELDKIIEDYDTHANNEQTQAFINLLTKKYGIDVKTFELPSQETSLAA
jgi:hypothetical protein